VDERGIGFAFLANTLVIVVQLPVAQLLEGRRRMAAYAVESVIWAGAWIGVFAAGRAAGGCALAFSPHALWPAAALAALACSAGALALERHIPPPFRRTPRRPAVALAEAT
jgi:hypothetical protein